MCGAWLWTSEPKGQHASRLKPDIVVERRGKKQNVSDAAAIWKPSSSRCAGFFFHILVDFVLLKTFWVQFFPVNESNFRILPSEYQY